MIDGWCKESPVPEFVPMKSPDEELGSLYLLIAKRHIEKKEFESALEDYRKAFMHRQRSTDYEAIPKIYDQLGESNKAVLSRLNLSQYQLQEGIIEEAIATLKSIESKEIDVTGIVASAQNKYAFCLEGGSGVEKNLVQAAEYYKRAADQGLATAQNNYAICLQNGSGVEKDLVQAAKYYKLAADQGFAYAQNNYAYYLQNGIGIEKNLARATEYFKLAADQGHAPAQYNYAFCLEGGIGVTKNLVQAAEYYKRAADQGLAPAQDNYARCLDHGIGVEKNLVQAAEYCKLAAAQGHVPAQDNYARLQRELAVENNPKISEKK
jgi:TPR repeat protein